MTETEINEAIARLTGWQDQADKYPCGEWGAMPNYCGSLDAMRKALDSMLFSKRQAYYSNLIEVMSQSLRSENPRLLRVADIECCLATAKQQAEAFLRAHGKWID